MLENIGFVARGNAFDARRWHIFPREKLRVSP